jgi:hypothetical protein
MLRLRSGKEASQPAARVARAPSSWPAARQHGGALAAAALLLSAAALARAAVVGGALWLYVPLLGFFRCDVALCALLAELVVALAARELVRRAPRWLAVGSLLATVGLVRIAGVPRLVVRGPFTVDAAAGDDWDARVAESVDPLVPATLCDEIALAVWARRDLWTHITFALALPNFVFGQTLNFDGSRSGDSAPWWSLELGLRGWGGHETARALDSDESTLARRTETTRALQALPQLRSLLRSGIASHLGVAEQSITFGREGWLQGLPVPGYPAIQIWLPCALWKSVLNVHTDLGVALRAERALRAAGFPHCDPSSAKTFIIPLTTPPGAGLLWYREGPDGEPVEHQQQYRKGYLYAFPAVLPHSIRPFTFDDWSLEKRITVQTFAMRCSNSSSVTWAVFH